MDLREAEEIRGWACGRKKAYGRVAAQGTASDMGGGVRGYRCPFGGEHWHVGHVPEVEAVERIATAVRVLAGNGPGDPVPVRLSRSERRRARRNTRQEISGEIREIA